MVLSENEKERMMGVRKKFEKHILNTFVGKEIWYQERENS
jgi:hypothetical protein